MEKRVNAVTLKEIGALALFHVFGHTFQCKCTIYVLQRFIDGFLLVDLVASVPLDKQVKNKGLYFLILTLG